MNIERKQQLKQSSLYARMQQITKFLDRYYLDGVMGLVPGGIGDAVSALFSLVHVYFSLFRLRSISLTLAVLNNTLRDIFLGMIPFFVGDVFDFFHKANKKNMALIDGFLNDDADIIRTVNTKAWQAGIAILAFIIGIFLMMRALVWVAQNIGALFT